MPHSVDMGFKAQPQPLRIVLGGDEAGFEYKQALIADLKKDPGVCFVDDVGPFKKTDTAAYPHAAVRAARKVCFFSYRPYVSHMAMFNVVHAHCSLFSLEPSGSCIIQVLHIPPKYPTTHRT